MERNFYNIIPGPQSWLDRYKVAEGNLQSPINIETTKAEDDKTAGPITFHYKSVTNSTITNDGRHLRVTLTRNESGKQATVLESYVNEISFVVHYKSST